MPFVTEKNRKTLREFMTSNYDYYLRRGKKVLTSLSCWMINKSSWEDILKVKDHEAFNCLCKF